MAPVDRSIDEGNVGVVANHVNLAFELCRQPEVVGIEKGDPISSSLMNAFVAGCRGPLSLLVEITDRASNGANQIPSVVGRAVIDDDDLTRWTGLRQDRFDRFLERRHAIIAGNDYADVHRGLDGYFLAGNLECIDSGLVPSAVTIPPVGDGGQQNTLDTFPPGCRSIAILPQELSNIGDKQRRAG